MVCRCFQQWSVEHSHTCRWGYGWPHSTDARQDRHIVRAVVTHPGKKFRHILHLLCHKDHWEPSACNRTLIMWRVDWRVEWCSVVFSVESRFCLYASDGRTPVQHRPGEHHLLECFRSQHIGHTSGLMVWGSISYNSLSHLVFLQGKVNSVHYNAQVVNPVLLSFPRQEIDVFFFQQDDVRPHTAAK